MKRRNLTAGILAGVLGLIMAFLVLSTGDQIDGVGSRSDTSFIPSTVAVPVYDSEAASTSSVSASTPMFVIRPEVASQDTLVVSDEENTFTDEKSTYTGPRLFVTFAYIPLDELIEDSSMIAIGEVGKVVATDYPAKYQTELPPEDDIEANEEYVRQVYFDRIAFHEFFVSETLKGEPHESFIFARDDVEFYEEYYGEYEVTKLLPGSKILLFVREAVKPHLLTNKVEHFYDTRGDNGIFDLDDQGRAFPRAPDVFRNLNLEDGYYDSDGPNPYFDLERLRATISR